MSESIGTVHKGFTGPTQYNVYGKYIKYITYMGSLSIHACIFRHDWDKTLE